MNPGDIVPDFTFQRPDGSAVKLSELLTADRTYVLFMRHFACLPCVAQVKEIARHYDRLKASGVEVIGVAHAPPDVTERYVERDHLPFPVVTDVSRESYRVMGLRRVSLWHFLRPRILFDGFRKALNGEKIRRLTGTEDVKQLGGDYVLDRGRRVLYVYPARDATDRAGVDDILAAH